MRLPAFLLVLLLAAPAALAPAARADEFRVIPPGDADELLGHTVLIVPPGKPAESIGRVVDVLVDPAGHPMVAVLDVGGFLGVGNRKVAVTWSALQFAPVKNGLTITLDLPAGRLRAAPGYNGPDKPVQAIGP